MIMTDDEVQIRLDSPLNLINRLRELEVRTPEIVSLPEYEKHTKVAVPGLNELPSIEDLIDNPEDRINLAGIKTASINTLRHTVELLSARVGDTEKPEKLCKIATDMIKVIDTINGDRREHHGNRPVVIFKPMIVNEAIFGPVIHVNE